MSKKQSSLACRFCDHRWNLSYFDEKLSTIPAFCSLACLDLLGDTLTERDVLVSVRTELGRREFRFHNSVGMDSFEFVTTVVKKLSRYDRDSKRILEAREYETKQHRLYLEEERKRREEWRIRAAEYRDEKRRSERFAALQRRKMSTKRRKAEKATLGLPVHRMILPEEYDDEIFAKRELRDMMDALWFGEQIH